MAAFTNAFISVVTTAPIFGSRERQWLLELHASLGMVLVDYEILIITADSDGLREQNVQSLLFELSCVRVVILTHSVNHDVATLAGLENAIGDFTVAVSAGIHSPDLIYEALTKASAGFDVVFGVSRARYGWVMSVFLRLLGGMGPSRDVRHLAPDYLNGLVCLNRQTLNQLLATGRLQHGLYDRMSKVASRVVTLVQNPGDGPLVREISRRDAIRRVLLSLLMDSTRLARRSVLFSLISFSASRVLPIFSHGTVMSGISIILEIMSWGGLMVSLWIISEYAYRSLEKDGQLYPYIIREELQSRVMNPLLKTNVVSES